MHFALALVFALWALNSWADQPVVDESDLGSCHGNCEDSTADLGGSDDMSLLHYNMHAGTGTSSSSSHALHKAETEAERGAETEGVTGNESQQIQQEFRQHKSDPHGHHGKHHASDKQGHKHTDIDHKVQQAEVMHAVGDEHSIALYFIVPISLLLVMALFIGRCLEHYVTWLPESGVTLALGLVLGFLTRISVELHAVEEEVFNRCCATLLTLFLLPVLMFESGWSLRKRDFASQVVYILILAVIGSMISFTVVGCCIMYTGQLGYHSITMPRTAFAYASLIAATDPVATLSTYQSKRVDPLLNILVFGDSTFNDAVAIVLFKVLNNDEIMHTPTTRPDLSEVMSRIGAGIFVIFGGSVLIGLGVAACFLVLLRFAQLHHIRTEILGLSLMAYLTFGLAEAVGMSGIIATVVASIVLGMYARSHLSAPGSLLADFFLGQVACFMDRMVFLFTGFCAVYIGTQPVAFKDSGWSFGLWAMLFCILGRAIAVFPCCTLINAIKRCHGRAHGHPEENWHIVSPGTMFMIWHASLRGAISLTLCMELGDWVDIHGGPGTRRKLQTATFFLICVFLFVFGGTTEYCLNAWNIKMGDTSGRDSLYVAEVGGWAKNFFSCLDEHIMVPLFVGQKDEDHFAYRKMDAAVDVEYMLTKMLSESQIESYLDSDEHRNFHRGPHGHQLTRLASDIH